MRRGAKTAKAKTEAEQAVTRRSQRNKDSSAGRDEFKWMSDRLPQRRAFIRQLDPTFSTRMVAARA
jgi:hypothetical protein